MYADPEFQRLDQEKKALLIKNYGTRTDPMLPKEYNCDFHEQD